MDFFLLHSLEYSRLDCSVVPLVVGQPGSSSRGGRSRSTPGKTPDTPVICSSWSRAAAPSGTGRRSRSAPPAQRSSRRRRPGSSRCSRRCRPPAGPRGTASPGTTDRPAGGADTSLSQTDRQTDKNKLAAASSFRGTEPSQNPTKLRF